MKRIDIHDPIDELCRRLGLSPQDVGEIIFRPSTVIATVYKTNGGGKKYVEVDGEIASEIREFEVTT